MEHNLRLREVKNWKRTSRRFGRCDEEKFGRRFRKRRRDALTVDDLPSACRLHPNVSDPTIVQVPRLDERDREMQSWTRRPHEHGGAFLENRLNIEGGEFFERHEGIVFTGGRVLYGTSVVVPRWIDIDDIVPAVRKRWKVGVRLCDASRAQAAQMRETLRCARVHRSESPPAASAPVNVAARLTASFSSQAYPRRSVVGAPQ